MPEKNDSVLWAEARSRFEDLLIDKCGDRTNEDTLRISRNTGVMEAAALLSGLTDRARAADSPPEIMALMTTLRDMVTNLVYK